MPMPEENALVPTPHANAHKLNPANQGLVKRLIVEGKFTAEIQAELEKRGITISRVAINKYRREPDVIEELRRRDSEVLQAGMASRYQRIGLHQRVIAGLQEKLFDGRSSRFKDDVSPMDLSFLLKELRSTLKEIGILVDGPGSRPGDLVQNNITQNNFSALINMPMTEEQIVKALQAGQEGGAPSDHAGGVIEEADFRVLDPDPESQS